MLGMPALSRTSLSRILSCHLMLRSLKRHVEVIGLFGMTTVESPGLASIEESGKYHCMVDLQLGGKAESSLLPNIFSKFSEGSAGFCDPVFDFCVNVHHL